MPSLLLVPYRPVRLVKRPHSIRLHQVLTVLIIWSNSVIAATFHVSPFGSNTPPFSAYSTAANRIIDAVRSASGFGDTVYLHAGHYVVDSSLFIPRGAIWLGVSRDSVIIDWADSTFGSTYLARLLGQNAVSGMEFRYPFGSNNDNAYALWGQTFPLADTVTIEHCRIRNFAVVIGGNTWGFVRGNEFYHGISPGLRIHSQAASVHSNLFVGGDRSTGIQISDAGNVVVEGNEVDNARVGGDRAHAGVYANSVTSLVVRNNLFRKTRNAILWYYASGVIENNTIIDGDRGSLRTELLQRYFETLSIRNNLFLNNRSAFEFGLSCDDCDSTGWITFAYNAFWPPVDTFYWFYPGDPPSSIKIFPYENFNAYPMLTPDLASQLQLGSPLIDAGDPSILDAEGSRSDVGWTGGPAGYSYEYLDLAPLPPDSLRGTNLPESITLSWVERPESDLAGYRVYRGTSPGFWNPALLPIVTVNPEQTLWQDSSPGQEDFVYYVVTAYDASNLESEPSVEIEVNLSAHAPEWAPISDQSVRVGDTLRITALASDADGDELALSIMSSLANAIFADLGGGNGAFTFIPASTQVGNHVVQLIASDGLLADTIQFEIEVLPENHAPVWIAIPPQQVAAGDTLTLGVSASDVDGDSVHLAMTTASLYASLTQTTNGGGVFVFAPPDHWAGDYGFEIIASDGNLAAALTILVRVLPRGVRSTSILKVYPNPMHDQAQIELYIEGPGTHDVRVVAHDAVGRTVGNIYEGQLAEGIHTVSWDDESLTQLGSLARGVYLLRLSVDGQSQGAIYKVALK